MAQVRALVRKRVLEELLSGEVLEVWIIDPAFVHAFVEQSVNCLSKKSPITNCVAIPGRPPSLYSGAISRRLNSQSILPASCTSNELLRDLPLELNAVGTLSGHGFHPLKAQLTLSND